MRSEEDFFSEFYLPEEIVTENGGNVEVLSIARFAYLKPCNKELKILVCSGFTVESHRSENSRALIGYR